MKVLHIFWRAFGKEDVQEEFQRRGYEEDIYYLDRDEDVYENQRLQQEIIGKLTENKYDFVFSFNYFPIVAIACNVCKIPYASWIYDSPVAALWHCSVVSPYNYIFIFDKADYLELKRKGIHTVYYLPLAANVERLDTYTIDDETKEVYSAPISFVGSLYTENKFTAFRKLNGLNSYERGYIDGLMQAQKRIFGNLLLEEMLPEEIVDKMRKVSRVKLNEDVGFSYLKYFGQIILPKWITAIERQEILGLISEKYPCHLYTHRKSPSLPKIINKGKAGSRKESCFIFKCSKINLNITLRSIRTGIPLRVFEIMGSGGFLLTNYQEDFLIFLNRELILFTTTVLMI